MSIWFKEMKHNPTEFTSDWPALMDRGCEYREELLKKAQANPENADAIVNDDFIMSKCIKNYGVFASDQPGATPTADDYFFHLTLGMLEHTCINDRLQNTIPRVILNNLVIKMIEKQVTMSIPLHQ